MWTDASRRQFARSSLRLPSDLTDAEWSVLEPLFPALSHGGRPPLWSYRQIVEAQHLFASYGYHGHGAGSSIGFWDNQKPDPKGEHRLRKNTAWSIELSAKSLVPEWNNQEVEFRSEEDAYFDGSKVIYLDGRQSNLHLIDDRPRR